MPEIPTPKLDLFNGSEFLEIVPLGQRTICMHLTSGPLYITLSFFHDQTGRSRPESALI